MSLDSGRLYVPSQETLIRIVAKSMKYLLIADFVLIVIENGNIFAHNIKAIGLQNGIKYSSFFRTNLK